MKTNFNRVLVFFFCFLHFGQSSNAQQTEEQMQEWLAGKWSFEGMQYPVGAGAKERETIDSVNQVNHGLILSCTVWGNCRIYQMINGEKRVFAPIRLKKDKKGFYLDIQGSPAYFRDINTNSMKLSAEQKPTISMKRIGEMLPPEPAEKGKNLPQATNQEDSE